MSFINLFVYIYDNLLLFVFTLATNNIRLGYRGAVRVKSKKKNNYQQYLIFLNYSRFRLLNYIIYVFRNGFFFIFYHRVRVRRPWPIKLPHVTVTYTTPYAKSHGGVHENTVYTSTVSV